MNKRAFLLWVCAFILLISLLLVGTEFLETIMPILFAITLIYLIFGLFMATVFNKDFFKWVERFVRYFESGKSEEDLK